MVSADAAAEEEATEARSYALGLRLAPSCTQLFLSTDAVAEGVEEAIEAHYLPELGACNETPPVCGYEY